MGKEGFALRLRMKRMLLAVLAAAMSLLLSGTRSKRHGSWDYTRITVPFAAVRLTAWEPFLPMGSGNCTARV